MRLLIILCLPFVIVGFLCPYSGADDYSHGSLSGNVSAGTVCFPIDFIADDIIEADQTFLAVLQSSNALVDQDSDTVTITIMNIDSEHECIQYYTYYVYIYIPR